MYETFFQCFESTGKAMDTIVMKNIFPLRYKIHFRLLESGCYNSSSRSEKEMVRNMHA